MNKQVILRLKADGAWEEVVTLPRKKNQPTDHAFRHWLDEHGEKDETYQVVEVVSPRIRVCVKQVKELLVSVPRPKKA